MRRPNLKKWKRDSNLKQLLLFAQTIDELLFHHTVDSYKSPALNSHLRAKELRFLTSDYHAGRLKEGALKPVIDELKWSFRNDAVIKSHQNNLYDTYLENIDKSIKDSNKLLHIVEALNEELDRNYWNALKVLIFEAVVNNGSDEDVVTLATSLSSEIEVFGFSRSYLYIENKVFFFEGDASATINEATCISNFLSKFDVKAKNWTVIFRGSKEFLALEPYSSHYNIEVSSGLDSLNAEEGTLPEFVLTEGCTLYVLHKNIKAKDQYAARDNALARLNAYIAAYKYHDHNIQPNFDQKAMCFDFENKSAYVIKEDPNPMTCRSVRSDDLQAEDINKSVDLLKGNHLTPFSTMSINRAFSYHKTALESSTPENQLLNLWASIEGLLPPPPSDGDRISFYLDALVPATTVTYSLRIFDYMSENLMFAGSSVRRIVESVDGGSNFQKKSLLILTAEDLEDKRQQLLSKIRYNPLLHHRCLLIHSKFSSTHKTCKTLREHKKKVVWHLQRIYITRNQIMHNAKSLPYIKTLVENLHTYVDIFIHCVTSLAFSSAYKKDISTFVRMINAHEATLLATLDKSDTQCTTSNYFNVVYGQNNYFANK